MNKSQLTSLLQKYRTPQHIILHMRKVAKVGLFLAKKMKERGLQVNESLVAYGSLLHDLVKIVDFSEIDETKLLEPLSAENLKFWKKLIDSYHADKHCLAGYKILKELKEEELALIVKKHGYNSLLAVNENDRPYTWEEKIVYYADKRVRHDQIVSLKERIEDGQKRYFPDGNVPANDKEVQKALFHLEEELCGKAGIKPQDINEESITKAL